MEEIGITFTEYWPAVWGQTNPFERTREYMNQPISLEGVGYLLMLVVAAATVWTILYWWENRQSRVPRRTAIASIFQDLCHVHGLSDPMIGQLESLAREWNLSDPAMLFVDPRPLEQRVSASSADRAVWEELGIKLFGQHFQPASSPRPVSSGPPEI